MIDFVSSPLSDTDIDRYTNGDCTLLASAMNDRGYPVGMWLISDSMYRHVATVHALLWVKDQDGIIHALDASGILSTAHMDEHWGQTVINCIHYLENWEHAELINGAEALALVRQEAYQNTYPEDRYHANAVAATLDQWCRESGFVPLDEGDIPFNRILT